MGGLKRGKNGTTSINDFLATELTVVNMKASAGTLTVGVQPTVGDTMTIGSTVYTFTTDGTAAAAGEIDVGGDLADCKLLIVSALKGTDGNNTAHTQVSCAGAFATDDLVITALTGGVAGDLIATTETFDSESNLFDAIVLGTTVAGVDGVPLLYEEGHMYRDDSYLYVCVNTAITGDNWRRVALGSTF